MLQNAIRNRTTEKDLRAWLDKNGFYGNSAQIKELELHAIQRPGWLQIFSFQVKAKSRYEIDVTEGDNDPWGDFFGVVRDDERRKGDNKTQVELFPELQQQQEKLHQWSDGLIRRRDQSSANLLGLTAAIIVSVVLILSIINLFS